MINFIGFLAFAFLCMYIGYCIGINAVQEDFEGYYVSRHTNGSKSENKESADMSFTYCKIRDIIEAFKVSDGKLPAWVLQPNIDVMISPEFKVIVHKQNGYNVIATSNDYLVKDKDGDYYSCPIEMFESGYLKVETN